MSQSQKMKKALEKNVVSRLRDRGFDGKYPHYKKEYPDRIELVSFMTNKWGNSFTVEVSAVFFDESKRDSNFCSSSFKNIHNATVWDTNIRYRLKGNFDGWFYYSDLYRQRIGINTFYNAVSEKKAVTYVPQKGEKLTQRADEGIYEKVCVEVNCQMEKAFSWLEAFYKNNKLKMMILERF